jgi:transcriptional regulator with PAS, ATPase and Fis domain
VLVQGETGTGKNRMAEFIHYHSQRRNGLFLRIDCAEFNRSLIESELFGHEKGAFTGVTEKKAGYLELVCGGTLFLDEIENPDHELQVKLLRVVEEKKFRRVGGREDIATDFRVISATNVDIEQLVQSGRFRKDLYFRLKGAELKIPPLRERREDIPIFIDYFLKEFGQRYGRQISISLEAMACLQAFPWTGNIRELRQVLEAMIAIAASTNINRIEFEHLPLGIQANFTLTWAEHERPFTLKNWEKKYIQLVLSYMKGNKHEAARILGISRNTLKKKMKELGLDSSES